MKVTTMRVMIKPAMILNVKDSPKKMVPTVINFRTGRYTVTCAFLHQILALHLMRWRDAATLRVCKRLICKEL